MPQPAKPLPHLDGWVGLLVVIGCFSLWDFYIGEVRIFDFAGMSAAALLLAALLALKSPILQHFDRTSILVVFAVFLLLVIYSIAGIGTHPENAKPAIGVLLGLVVLALFRIFRFEPAEFAKCLRIVGWIHLAAFWLQLVSYYALGVVLNFHFFLGLEPRLLSSIFRPAGLFLEPAICCFFFASIFILRRQLDQQKSLLDYLILASMVASLSMWGIGVAFILALIFAPRTALLVCGASLAVGIVALQSLELAGLPVYQFFERRLMGISSDGSVQSRFSGTLDIFRDLLADPRILFGKGVDNFFEVRGSNGFAFIVNSLGVLGSSLLLFLFLLLAPPRKWPLFLLGMALLLTAAPLWKVSYFWFWIAAMTAAGSIATQRGPLDGMESLKT